MHVTGEKLAHVGGKLVYKYAEKTYPTVQAAVDAALSKFPGIKPFIGKAIDNMVIAGEKWSNTLLGRGVTSVETMLVNTQQKVVRDIKRFSQFRRARLAAKAEQVAANQSVQTGTQAARITALNPTNVQASMGTGTTAKALAKAKPRVTTRTVAPQGRRPARVNRITNKPATKVAEQSMKKPASELSQRELADRIRQVDHDVLDKMETAGGHTLARHQNKSTQFLTRRAMREPIKAAGTFTNKRIGTKAVQQNFRNNADKIADWVKNGTDEKICEFTHKYELGKCVFKKGKQVKNNLLTSRVVLIKDPTHELGFFMRTSFPIHESLRN